MTTSLAGEAAALSGAAGVERPTLCELDAAVPRAIRLAIDQGLLETVKLGGSLESDLDPPANGRCLDNCSLPSSSFPKRFVASLRPAPTPKRPAPKRPLLDGGIQQGGFVRFLHGRQRQPKVSFPNLPAYTADSWVR